MNTEAHIIEIPQEWTKTVLLPVNLTNLEMIKLDSGANGLRFEAPKEGKMENYNVVPYYFLGEEMLPASVKACEDIPYSADCCFQRTKFVNYLFGKDNKDGFDSLASIKEKALKLETKVEKFNGNTTTEQCDETQKELNMLTYYKMELCVACHHVYQGNAHDSNDKCPIDEVMIEYHLVKAV